MKKIFISLVLGLLILFPLHTQARTNITDWYIKDFQSEIKVNKDSTLLITENITADCGNLPNKHGIFRVLPTVWKTTSGEVKQPVELISITDFNGKKINYTTSTSNGTITWKIGDADKTVQGVNNYRITYTVRNAVIFKNPEFDEWYWNITGNFWDIEMDNFSVKIIFPDEVTKENSQVEYYAGALGSKNKDLAEYKWLDNHTLEFDSLKTLPVRQGVTVSVTFPKNIFTPTPPTWGEKYHWLLVLIATIITLGIPLIAFIICFILWKKYGKDPKVDKTIIPEFGVPDDITPLQMGMVLNHGSFKNDLISATLISLAVKGVIKIEELEEKVLLFKSKDLKITLVDKNKLEAGDPIEKFILDKILRGKESKKMSSLKNSFTNDLSAIKKKALEDVKNKGWIADKGIGYRGVFFVIAFVLIFIGFFLLAVGIGLGLWGAAIVFFIFAFFMPKRTPEGAELLWKIKGFKLYMETAEKYRQQFYEKENIFEKFLPYAMVFGIAKLWAEKIKEIYGQEYFDSYHPVWYVGAGDFSSFDAASFTESLNSITTSISSNVSSGSGSGGGGFSGGGGGGGGGGGW